MNKGKIADYLVSLGVPPHIFGFKAWCVAIQYAIEHQDDQMSMMELYEKVGAALGKSVGAIERNLRTAVEYAFETTMPEKLYKVFETFLNKDSGKVTNKVFLYTVVYNLMNEGGNDDD